LGLREIWRRATAALALQDTLIFAKIGLTTNSEVTMNAAKSLLAVLILGGALSLSAQSYSIDWYTIDGGGGTSSGGPYTLSGTIGQPDAGVHTGGPYTLVGGFWGAFAVQQVGAPTLYIRPAGPGQVTIYWDPPTPGFALQESSNLSLGSGGWSASPSGGTNPVTVPTTSIKFYRLQHP